MHTDLFTYHLCGLVILHKWLCFVTVVSFPETGLNYTLLRNNKIYLQWILKYNTSTFAVSSPKLPHNTSEATRNCFYFSKMPFFCGGGTNSGAWGLPKYKISKFIHTLVCRRTGLCKSISNMPSGFFFVQRTVCVREWACAQACVWVWVWVQARVSASACARAAFSQAAE